MLVAEGVGTRVQLPDVRLYPSEEASAEIVRAAGMVPIDTTTSRAMAIDSTPPRGRGGPDCPGEGRGDGHRQPAGEEAQREPRGEDAGLGDIAPALRAAWE